MNNPAPQTDWPNLATMMFELAERWPNRVLYRFFREGSWRCLRWDESARMAASAARALIAMGIREGTRVLICSENRPEVPITELALLAIGAVPVFAYVTNTEADHLYLLHDSGAQFAIASSIMLAERILAAATQTDSPARLICMEASPGRADLICYERLMDGRRDDFADIAAMATLIPPHQLACLIYTSGTGGTPKGVMLSHRAIRANCRDADQVMRGAALFDQTYLSFLPISHAFEHTVGQFFLASQGAQIAYARGIEHLSADMMEIRPDLMVVVPRLLEAIRSRILNMVGRQPAWKQRLFQATLHLGLLRQRGDLTMLQQLQDMVLHLLVRRKLRQRFGGRLHRLVSGGARLRPDVGEFFQGLGVAVMQGYGQTEAGPVLCLTKPCDADMSTVGAPFPSVELKIAPDGEILARGPFMMDGYWHNEQASEATLRDGWLHTGDIGFLNSHGNLVLTDRKKDIIVLSGGENISPAKLESLLAAEPEIAQAVVYGDHGASLAALIVPEDGVDAAAIPKAIARVNAMLSITERIRRHKIVPAFTIENGLLTPTHKIKRLIAMRHYLPEPVA